MALTSLVLGAIYQWAPVYRWERRHFPVEWDDTRKEWVGPVQLSYPFDGFVISWVTAALVSHFVPFAILLITQLWLRDSWDLHAAMFGLGKCIIMVYVSPSSWNWSFISPGKSPLASGFSTHFRGGVRAISMTNAYSRQFISVSLKVYIGSSSQCARNKQLHTDKYQGNFALFSCQYADKSIFKTSWKALMVIHSLLHSIARQSKRQNRKRS